LFADKGCSWRKSAVLCGEKWLARDVQLVLHWNAIAIGFIRIITVRDFFK
jgi:hypothetical protein